MEPDGTTYHVPHPTYVRIILVVCGSFAVFMALYELWPGVWPINLTTPFFAAILAGAMWVGFAFIQGGLMAPSLQLAFRSDGLEIMYHWPWRKQTRVYPPEEIVGVSIEERETSEGPNDWYAVITLMNGEKIPSRPLARKEAAEELAAKFSGLLAGGTAGSRDD